MHWIDPACLPEIRGRFARFLLNPHGEADGLLLTDGREVHFPPHMARNVVPAIEAAPEAELRIRGVIPRAGDVFAAVSIELPDGTRFEDDGPPEHGKHDKHDKHGKPPKPHGPGKRVEMSVDGTVQRVLHGPKGERRGVLLDSGEIVRFPPHEAEAIEPWLASGARLTASGKGLRTRLGVVVELAGPDLRGLHAGAHSRPGKAKPEHQAAR